MSSTSSNQTPKGSQKNGDVSEAASHGTNENCMEEAEEVELDNDLTDSKYHIRKVRSDTGISTKLDLVCDL